MSNELAITGLKQVAAGSQHRPIAEFVRLVRHIARHSHYTRLADWAIEVQIGPLRIFTPLERDDWTPFAGDVAGRERLIYRVPVWFAVKAVCSAVWRRVSGVWR